MKLETEEILRVAVSDAAPKAMPAAWRQTATAIAATLAVILAVYWETVASTVALWVNSETYTHGFFILPLSLYLVWRQRHELARIAPRPDLLGFFVLGGAGFAWITGAAAQVQVLEQYAVTAMIPGAVLALAGRRAALAMAFPLAFLLLAVPFGEAFLPPLMSWTADFTVGALRLTGVPVYREGNLFAIPTGTWSVVEACSGLRYLIASVTVGALFAYLNYQRAWKRAVFIALSIAVPIAANFVRAYMIVMIGHVSNMKLAVGVDHFIYGWVFFGVVIGLLFWLGSFGRDPAPQAASEVRPVAQGRPASSAAIAAAAFGCVAIASVWSIYAAQLDTGPAQVRLATPAGASGWLSDPTSDMSWRPRYAGAAASTFQVYRKGERTVALYVGYYRDQRQGAELVNFMNRVDTKPAWINVGTDVRSEDLGAPVELRQTHLRGRGERLLVWEWYRIGRNELSNPFLAKALLARDKLLGRGDESAAIILAAPYEARPELAAESLRQFAREMRPSLDAALAAVELRKPQ
ncbi:MAG TPA: exosortase A [Burkholderiales bacterium]|nr:exosortase A [Burkholderiales bacterium]